MIIPVGHESTTVRRLPWVTFVIIAICFVVHIFISRSIDDHLKEVETHGRELLEYYFQHPYLNFDSDIQKMMFGEQTEVFERQLDMYRRIPRQESLISQEEEQEELSRLSQNFREALQDVPYRKWGYIPAEQSLLGLLAYMFIHGGFLHLLGNMFMLYLMGPFIEDVWGRPIYTVFYLVMGALAALLYGMHYPDFQGPLIGASGAIAGVMGAFLIRYLRTKITFFYFFFPFFRGTFQAPAWLMLPLWLLLQLFSARMMDSVNSQGGGGGVAYWAHIWGFLLGVAVSYGMKVFKVEEKYIHTKIEAKIDTGDALPKAINEVINLKRMGKIGEAFYLLNELASQHAANPETAERLWDLGTDIGIKKENEQFFTSLIEKEIRRDQMKQALLHYKRLKEKLPEFRLHQTYKTALMDFLVQRNEIQEATPLANELLEEIKIDTSPGLLFKVASTALKLDSSIAQKAVDLCDKHPEITPDQKAQLKKDLELKGHHT